jgi:hypothetical protein
MAKTLTFPFGKGLNQADDDRMLTPGVPRAIENLVVAKNGRLAMRFDYDALAMTLPSGATFSLFDLCNYGNTRLLGLGQLTSGAFAAQTPGVQQVYEFVNQSTFGWTNSRATGAVLEGTPMLSLGAYPRIVGNIIGQTATIATMDCAAGNGLLCMVWQISVSGTPKARLRVIVAATNATVLAVTLPVTNAITPRVVCTGTKFFVSCVDNATGTIKLFRFDPATDTDLVALTNPAGAGNAVTSYDMSLSHERTSFWIAYGRNTPVTQIHGFDVNGANTHNIAGPAVATVSITVFTQAANSVQRIHLACVITGTLAVNLSTYLGATSVLQTNTPAEYTAAASQVGMCVNTLLVGQIMVAFQKNGTISLTDFTDSTHAISGTRQIGQGAAAASALAPLLNTKLLNVRGHGFFGALLHASNSGVTGQNTHLLYSMLESANLPAVFPAAAGDYLFADLCSVFFLPNMAFDAATGLSYWPRLYRQQNGFDQPELVELDLVGNRRRQTALLGDALYLSGGVTSVFDGYIASEASFITPPVIGFNSQANAGSLTALGTYQIVGVYEFYDSQANRVQSSPSAVLSVTLTGVNTAISVDIVSPFGFRMNALFGGAVDRDPVLVLYRTQNAALGNLTFYRDSSFPANAANIQGGGITTLQLVLSDAALGVNEVLYTQGSRGSLSGPLPFVAPEGCSSIVASADRILSGGLPASGNIEESRPLFPAEQTNWSDTLGFQRQLRGDVLAVARLDERRLAFTASEIFEMSGAGLDDNGNGDIGAPRRLPSDVGLFGGSLGWRSMVECSLGIIFQGTADQLYLLPRGGRTPHPIGLQVQSSLAAFPVITSATYIRTDTTVRFTCNNSGGTDSIFILYDVIHDAWSTEGPFGVPTAAATQYLDRLAILQSNAVKLQRTSNTPVAIIPNAWRSGAIHPFGLGQWGHIYSEQFYGEYQGDCALRCILNYDDQGITETLTAEVNALQLVSISDASNSASQVLALQPARALGDPYSFKFTPNQMKCECVRVDFEVDVPFPNLIDVVRTTTTNSTLAFNLPTIRQAGDRSVVFAFSRISGGGNPTIPGWTLLSSFVSNTRRMSVLELILTGGEATSNTITFGIGTNNFIVAYTVRNSHPTAPSEFAITSGATSPLNTATVTPSWGTQNSLWLAGLGVHFPPTVSGALNISAPPAGYRRGSNSGVADNGTTAGGELFVMDQALRTANQAPTWGYLSTANGTTAQAITVAVRPNPALASAGLVYHYWAMDVEDAGKSALKSPLQMG